MIHLDERAWAAIERVNAEVNADIRYRTDPELYGKPDFWTVVEGQGQGDCDDYALTKRARLIAAGFDHACLRPALCYTETREAHLVLTVDTDRGTFILDNRHAAVLPYDALLGKYEFLARQAPGKFEWVWIEQPANR